MKLYVCCTAQTYERLFPNASVFNIHKVNFNKKKHIRSLVYTGVYREPFY